MREADPEPIRKALEEIDRGSRDEARFFQQIERWRDELLAGDDQLLEDIPGQFPEADRGHLRRLTINARKEKVEGKSNKSSRALFQYLKELSRP